jgi:hypothetical protein
MQIEQGDYFIVGFHKRWENVRIRHTGEIEEGKFIRSDERSYFSYIFKAHYVTSTLVCAEIVGFLNCKREEGIGRKIILRLDEVELETISKAELHFAEIKTP